MIRQYALPIIVGLFAGIGLAVVILASISIYEFEIEMEVSQALCPSPSVRLGVICPAPHLITETNHSCFKRTPYDACAGGGV